MQDYAIQNRTRQDGISPSFSDSNICHLNHLMVLFLVHSSQNTNNNTCKLFDDTAFVSPPTPPPKKKVLLNKMMVMI